MPGAVIPFPPRALRAEGTEAEFVILSLAPAGSREIPFGVMLIDERTNQIEWKVREDLDGLPLTSEDAELASFLNADFQARVEEQGGTEFLKSLEDSLTGFLRVSSREAAAGSSARELLNRLYEEHVDCGVKPFVTHLPFYSLRAAATRFGEDLEVEQDVEWVRAPDDLRLSPELFVVQVVGRSMEPLIPDGSLTVFRKYSAGSRQGKRLLIEELGVTDSSARFTVKRYTSVKKNSGEGWRHENIRLEPLNPEFPAFDLDPETFENRYRVLGEFVAVLPRD
jgi:phage repressor protein C with HTH and peptisase S24 domain